MLLNSMNSPKQLCNLTYSLTCTADQQRYKSSRIWFCDYMKGTLCRGGPTHMHTHNNACEQFHSAPCCGGTGDVAYWPPPGKQLRADKYRGCCGVDNHNSGFQLVAWTPRVAPSSRRTKHSHPTRCHLYGRQPPLMCRQTRWHRCLTKQVGESDSLVSTMSGDRKFSFSFTISRELLNVTRGMKRIHNTCRSTLYIYRYEW